MSDIAETEPKKLHGAAAASAAKKAETFTIGTFMKGVSENLDAALNHAKLTRDVKQEELAQLDRDINTLEAIKAVQEGKFNPSPAPRRISAPTGDRAPRGSWQQKILDTLHDESDGLPRSD